MQQGNPDILFGCELGRLGQGLRCEFINEKDILEEPFGDILFAEVDNYIALCRFRQSAVVLHAPPGEVHNEAGCSPRGRRHYAL